MHDNGLITLESQYSVGETIDRLVGEAQRARLIIFARIDHAANARELGEDLRPTELLIFGHPRGGTPLMMDRQTAGIDLPVKALAWQDADGRVFLTYNDAHWLSRRHELGRRSAEGVGAISEGLAALAQAAARPSR